MIQSGHLLAGTDPVGFLDTIATELKDLRAENVKLKEKTMSKKETIEAVNVRRPDFGQAEHAELKGDLV